MATVSPALRGERKARREERRQQQRLQNPLRALKMRGSRVDFYARGPSTLAASAVNKHRLHVGCSGWFYWHWRDRFYPKNLPTSKWLNHYMKHFTTVELNAPFYAWPTLKTVESWKKQALKRKFLYTIKVCELITHIKKFRGTKTLIKDFGLIADILGPSFGCFLFQLPPSFHYTPARLKMIVDQLEPGRKNVVEFRHKSWWNEEVYFSFRKKGIIFCSTSAPNLPNDFIQTADDVYIRFHGTKKWYRHDYTGDELRHWTHQILKSNAQNVWAYFNNDFDGFAIQNALKFQRILAPWAKSSAVRHKSLI